MCCAIYEVSRKCNNKVRRGYNCFSSFVAKLTAKSDVSTEVHSGIT